MPHTASEKQTTKTKTKTFLWYLLLFTTFNLYSNHTTLHLQWNPDSSNTRLLKTPDSSNQKSFPLDLPQSNTVILPPIFRMLDFSKLTPDISN